MKAFLPLQTLIRHELQKKYKAKGVIKHFLIHFHKGKIIDFRIIRFFFSANYDTKHAQHAARLYATTQQNDLLLSLSLSLSLYRKLEH